MLSEKLSNGSELKLAVVVPEVRVADVAFNTAQIKNALANLKSGNPVWIIFPRLCLTGSTCGDLFRQKILQDAALQALLDLVPLTSNATSRVLVGLPLAIGSEVYEGLALLSGGQVESLMVARFPYSPALSPSVDVQEGTTVNLRGKMVPLDFGQSFTFGQAEILLGQQPPSNFGNDLLINLINLPALAPAELFPQTAFNPATRQGITVICSAGASESTTDQVFSEKPKSGKTGFALQPRLN